MTKHEWDRLAELLDKALIAAPDERDRVIDEMSGGERELSERARAMLASADFSEMLERGPLEDVSDLGALLGGGIADAVDAATPETVPHVRLVEEIGRGGMGRVFLGEQEEYERRVAVKILRDPVRGNRASRRLQRESRFLASFNHPNIAQMFEAGITSHGHPYLVMELVEGTAVDRHCDANEMNVKERLELFVTICSAVSYTHQRLVVHSDLKPANILVTGAGEPKLVDFGIAKLVDPDSGEPVSLPESGFPAMTPEYASPEQTAGKPITVVSDVYSLGVILYRLLTGRRPYYFSGLEAAIRAICEVEPERPSAVLGGSDASPRLSVAEVSRRRRSSPERLKKALTGDLDAIVMKALRKEPSRRYPSVEELSRDVKRYLDARPVEAAKGSLTYRVEKFVRRRRGAVTVGVAAILLVCGFVVQNIRQRAVAEAERDRFRAVSELLVATYDAADPLEGSPATPTLRELLDARVESVRAMRAQPELQVAFLTILGRVYRNLGLHDEAGPLLEQALGSGTAFHGERHLDVAETQHHLGVLRTLEGDYLTGETLLRASLDTRTALGAGDEELTDTLDRLATVLQRQSRFDDAEAVFERTLEHARSAYGDSHEQVSRVLSNFAILYQEMERREDSEEMFLDAVAMARDTGSDGSAHFGTILNNLGQLYHELGRDHEAVPIYEESLAIKERTLAENHPRIATTLDNLAQTYSGLGRYAEAESMYLRGMEIIEANYGPEHERLAFYANNLAAAYESLERYEDAEPLYRRAIRIFEAHRGRESPSVGTLLNNLGHLSETLGKLEQAGRLYDESLAIKEGALGPEHTSVAATAYNLARWSFLTGDLDVGFQHVDRALSILTAKLPEDHWRIAYARAVRGYGLSAAGRYSEAEPLLRVTLDKLEGDTGPHSRYTKHAARWLRELYRATGEPDRGATVGERLAEPVQNP